MRNKTCSFCGEKWQEQEYMSEWITNLVISFDFRIQAFQGEIERDYDNPYEFCTLTSLAGDLCSDCEKCYRNLDQENLDKLIKDREEEKER